jgi:hypothetical protein
MEGSTRPHVERLITAGARSGAARVFRVVKTTRMVDIGGAHSQLRDSLARLGTG